MTRARNIADIGDDVAGGGSLVTTSSPSLGRRNLIINGAMQVAQRGTSFSAAGYNLDRFAQDAGRTNTVEQSTDAPEGFTYSHKTSGGTQSRNTWTSVELPAVGTSGLFYEGNTFTLSFYAKDSGTQSMSLAVQFSDSGTALTNAVSIASSSVSLTTTWTRYNYTFTVGSGVTPAGTNDCVVVRFTVSNTSDTVYLTGVQLEVGSVATPFEHRSYGEELDACMRYFQYYSSKDYVLTRTSRVEGNVNDANVPAVRTPLSKWMRANPTATFSNASVTSSGTDFRFIGFYGNTSISAGQTDLRTTTVNLDAEL